MKSKLHSLDNHAPGNADYGAGCGVLQCGDGAQKRSAAMPNMAILGFPKGGVMVPLGKWFSKDARAGSVWNI